MRSRVLILPRELLRLRKRSNHIDADSNIDAEIHDLFVDAEVIALMDEALVLV